MISSRKDRVAKLLRPFARLLEKTHLSPNAVTVLGFLFTLLIVPFTVLLDFTLAAIMVLVTGFFDALDGALARLTEKVTPRGGFLDSILDRYSDAIIMVAIIYSGLCNVVWGIVALVGFLLVSYSRARVEAYGVKRFVVGFADRPLRLILLAIAFFMENWFAGSVNYVIIMLAILTHLTVLQRGVLAKDALSKTSRK